MLKARVITALVLVALLGTVLFQAPAIVGVITFGAVAVLACWEWAGLMGKDANVRRLFALLGLFFCWQIFRVADSVFPLLFLASALFWIVMAPIWLRTRWPLTGNDSVGFGVGLLVIVPTWAAMVSLLDRGPWFLLGCMAVVWVADIAAYFAGRSFGRRKLAPSVSPGKTWEGAAGGLLGVMVYGLAVQFAGPGTGFSIVVLLLLLAVLTGLSILGDLFESLLKRQAGLKDSSGLLPGHGGILDRIDALMPTLPIMALIAMRST